MNGQEWSLLLLCIISVCFHVWGIIRILIEQQLSKMKNILLLNSLIHMLIIAASLIAAILISSYCFLPQGILVFSLTITVFFQTWQLLQEYLALNQSVAVFHKKQPTIFAKSLGIYCFALSLAFLSGFESEDIPVTDKSSSSTCLDFINSPLLNSKIVLSITQIAPLSTAVIFTVVLIYYLTVKLQRRHGITFSCEKMMLPITCLVVDFCLMLSVSIQLEDESNYEGSRKDTIRQLGIYLLTGALVIHPVVQFSFKRVKVLPEKRFKSFSSSLDDGSIKQITEQLHVSDTTKAQKPAFQKRFLSDDEHDLPGQQAYILKNPLPYDAQIKSIADDN